MKDLVCLAADNNIEAVLGGLLARPQALGLRAIEADLPVHPHRDPGCFHTAHEFLRQFRGSYRHALVVFDAVWAGAPSRDALVLEEEVRRRLGDDGWADVVVVDPEIEAWVWSDSPHVEECLGWRDRKPDLRTWLCEQALWTAGQPKPADPKTAVERALQAAKVPRSSAIYRKLARSVSVERCTDGSFARLRKCLLEWFPRSCAAAQNRDHVPGSVMCRPLPKSRP